MTMPSDMLGGEPHGGDGGYEPPSMPWDVGPSILGFVRSHVAEGKPGMSDDGYTLPDEDRLNRGSKLRWAAGAWDGVTTHHMGAGQDEGAVRKTVELVLAYSRQPTAANKAAVYRHVIAAPRGYGCQLPAVPGPPPGAERVGET